jgi:hypothetical protein
VLSHHSIFEFLPIINLHIDQTRLRRSLQIIYKISLAETLAAIRYPLIKSRGRMAASESSAAMPEREERVGLSTLSQWSGPNSAKAR